MLIVNNLIVMEKNYLNIKINSDIYSMLDEFLKYLKDYF